MSQISLLNHLGVQNGHKQGVLTNITSRSIQASILTTLPSIAFCGRSILTVTNVVSLIVFHTLAETLHTCAIYQYESDKDGRKNNIMCQRTISLFKNLATLYFGTALALFFFGNARFCTINAIIFLIMGMNITYHEDSNKLIDLI